MQPSRINAFLTSPRVRAYAASATMATLLALLVADVALAAVPVQEEGGSAPSIWLVLLPLLASATAVERVIEVLWNYIDWFLLNARDWQQTDLRSGAYTQFKSGTSLVLGIVLGILISNYTGMRLFDYLRPLTPRFLDIVPPVWDVLITGFIIGAGTKPVHDLLGIITQTKNLLGSSAVKQREAAGAMLAEGVLKLAQSDAQALIDVPGVGPARLAQPGQARTSEDGETLVQTPSSTEQYIRTIHARTTH